MSIAKKLFSSVLVLSLLAGCSSSSAGAAASESTGKYTPGTYEGTGTGMGSITASVTVDENQIVSVDLDLSGETESIGQQAGDTLVQQIMDAQSTDIDGVSGATVTSDGVKDAVQAALDQASGSSPSSGAIADGTYTGTAHGSKSEITVQVTVKDSAITDIAVTDEADSPYISDAAFNAIPQRIIDAQSVAIDNVTGATLTSTGIRNAVDAALKSSGADISSFEKVPEKEEKQLDDVNTDVLVVGGGASGLTAALAAKTDDQLSDTDSGLNVIVVESNGYAGGNLALCGGYVASYFGTELNDATGNSWDPDELVDALEAAHQDYSDIVNDSLMRSIASENADVINGLISRGFYLSAGDAYEGTTTVLSADGSAETYTTSSVVADDEGDRSGDNGYDIYG
ncbi:MAG: FMN-binding protein, partial [Bulleidia sp.]